MLRLKISIFVASVALSAAAQPQFFHLRTTATNCKFEIPNTPDALACDNDLDRGIASMCTVKFLNSGTDPCTGHFAGAMGPATQGTVDQASTSGITTTCRTVGLTPLPTTLSDVSALETAALCEGDGTVAPGGSMTMTARITPSLTVAAGRYKVGATDTFAGWENAVAAEFDLANCNLSLSAPSVSQSGVPYNLTWTAAFSPTTYAIEEATKADFSDAKTSTTSALTQAFTHTAAGTSAAYYYRARASTCRGSLGPYSVTAQVNVAPAADPSSKSFEIVVQQGSTTVVVQNIHVDGLPPNVPFSATVDQSFLTVTPSSGTTSAAGTADLTVRADPSSLGIGTNSGTVTVTTAHAKSAGRIVALDGNSKSVPVSVNVATAVTATPKTPPPASTWIIPAVAHTDGIGARFISDIRLANVNTAATSPSSYQLTFTASNSDGSKSGRQTKIELAAGSTVALNDILKNVFGLATTAADARGVLEIRVLGAPTGGTVASSRTYSLNTAGSFGQLVPAIAIDKVANAGGAPLILAHAGQTAAQRMNVGIVESLGFATSGHIRAYGANGQQIADLPFSLRPFEQQQINSFLARNGLNVSSARIEVSVDPAAAGTTSGGVTAYASMLDNQTQDASVVAGVKASALTSKRYVLPGIAAGTPVGGQSEVRVLNAGTAAAAATLTFYPRNGNAIVKTASIAPGEIKSFENIVASLFGASAADGSLVVTTPSDAQLLITGRTFNTSATGATYGVLQTALTANDGLGNGDSAQILQLEESDRFRTDLVLAETSGSPVTVSVKYTSPDSKVSASTDIPLNANEFRSETSIMQRMPGVSGATYNGRLTITVSGSGRVAAYGTLVDKATNDATLLPAQR